MSQIKQYKAKMKAAKEDILKSLRWSDSTFEDFFIDQAKSFLQTFFPEDNFPIEAIYQCSIFWQWWKNEWYMRDASFLVYADSLPVGNKEKVYRYLHSAEYLNKKPQKPVMEAMMETVSRELKKEIQSQNAAVYAVQGIINELLNPAV